jgi:DNA-binding SARP family transcriptional activator/pimeloyl-ACP methyl ester carboxylesterase
MELRLLGPMALVRDGEALPLPASKKTRALLAYLAVSGKPERRERLCHLLWEMPDDPKGALRWSLSKLRGLVGAALMADRETARLDCGAIDIDWHRLSAGARGLADRPIEQLESLAMLSGEFVEGLELSHCDGFAAWAVALREDARRSQAAVLAEITSRAIAPDRALPHARAWTEIDPANPDAHATLVRLLDAAGRGGEAGQQRTIGIRRLTESGAHVPAALRSAGPAEPVEETATQQVRFCTASDGTNLAYSIVGGGAGLPLVKAANWLNHLEEDFNSPVWRHWIGAFARDRALLRYDERGNGLSDWHAPLSFEAFVDDLESVVDAARLDRFDMIGISQGASVAIAYAVRHPARVRRILIWGGYASGWMVRADPEEVARREPMLALTRQGWALDNPAFRQMFTSLYVPEGTLEHYLWFNELQRVTTSPENAEALQRVFATIDVRDLLPRVTTPTLVAHSTRDGAIPFEAGRAIAARIPGARFAAIESSNHILLEHEPGWAKFANLALEFLA